MKVTILSWNVGGQLIWKKGKLLRLFLKMLRAHSVYIQETKWEVSSMRVVRCLASSRFGD